MIKVLYCFLALIFFLLNPAYSHKYSEDGITSDFNSMLKRPLAHITQTTPNYSESFATRVTKPFAQNPNQNMSFFSDSRSSYGSWNSQHKTHTSRDENISALNIFETMGISRRGILNDGNPNYKNISDAEITGMLGIIKGDLGFRSRPITAEETIIIARELLNGGRSMEHAALTARIKDLEAAYKKTADNKIKQHLQISALLILAGYDRSLINDSAWYLGAVGTNVRAKINGYADQLLPTETVAQSSASSPVFPGNLRDIVIDRLKFEESGQQPKPQHIFGTSGIQGSMLHTSLGEARYPDVMVLGSHKVPMKKPKDMLSITAQISPNHYFVIMQPEDNRDPVLRPQYMSATAAGGSGETNIHVQYLDKTTEDLKVVWNIEQPSDDTTSITGLTDFKQLRSALRSSVSQVKPTEKRPNDGQLTISSSRKIENDDFEETYSLIARVQNNGQEKHFYYWCPTPSQMNELKTFATDRRTPFTLGELYDQIERFDEDMSVPKTILNEISALLNRNLNGFQR
jgi:hypothetical protein